MECKMKIHRAHERGQADHGWLKSAHTFSFADWHDPERMGFRNLRVINEDRVAPGRGFGTHGHRDMEIVSWVLEGALSHRDSMGNGSTLRPGNLQRMTAGTGVLHSEQNASATEPVHFLQIWILPAQRGLLPGYAEGHVPPEQRRGRLAVLASPDGREGSVVLNADAVLSATLLDGDEAVEHTLAAGRHAWVHVARGSVNVGDERLGAGDAAQVDAPGVIRLHRGEGAEVLLFDLP